MIKKKHHYVWREYLREWSTEDQIVCKRLDQIFTTNLNNIAQEKYFYKLNELTKDDVELVRMFFIQKLDSELMKELNDEWIKIFDFVVNFRNKVETEGISDVLKEQFENTIINFEEELQSNYENIGAPYLNLLKQGNVDFYQDNDSNISFNLYIAMQYFRTKKIQSTVIKESEGFPIFKIERTWKILAHIFATNLAGSLYRDKDEFHCILLFNETELPFITGDQPVINTYGIYNKVTKNPPTEMELYYPLTPKMSLLITKKPELVTIKYQDMTIERVVLFNSLIADAADEQLYSNSYKVLEKYHLTTAST